MIATYVISLALLGLSGVLIDMHRRSWRTAEQNEKLSGTERRFALSQYRRRMQASGIIGVLGVAIGCEPLVPREPLPMVLYGISLAGACLAIMLLAALDLWASRRHFARLESDELTADFKRIRELRMEAAKTDETAGPLRK